MYEFLDRRYALALYDVCEKNGTLEQTLEDLSIIVESMETSDELIKIIEHPQIHRAAKKEIFINLFKDQVSQELLDFLILLIDKDRILYLKEKYNQMRLIYFERHNMLEVDVRSAVKLSEEQKSSLKEKLEKKYNKEIIISEKVDKSLLGGMFIKVGDDVIDGTVRNRVEVMKGLMEEKRKDKVYEEDKFKILTAVVKTVNPLTEIQKENLITNLKEFYNREFIIKEVIDSSILGGIHITVGEDIIDATVKGKLIGFKQRGSLSKDPLLNKSFEELNENIDEQQKLRKYDNKKKIIEAEVRTATPLNHTQKEDLEKRLSEFYSSNVVIREVIDKNILGGVYIKIGEDIIDGTVKGKMKNLKRSVH
ncbi:MAG: F0F1 ATP synthase subunit delta [Clostridium argentinense]|uniref:ATP synthase subunit delta n=1 Tax=Clostridium faecium TaxID=2762223 RepID=A0ABR8YUS9_9CLOT|nr:MULTISPECIES: F0F1 ATP synthase subunit delta [Clostridium]MBD8047619.1 F0F1 ATP synthase subunit delta [Clostridium faecium]MBS5823256.1 F0F1 ATP synthase subunit delta [Clostridium argentinense]MDU1349650.1 F0F1 ATP synthase subunit delta [Clostridium argentinense]